MGALKKQILARPEGASETAARSAPDLDRVIHERVRLGILSALAANTTMTFSELKALLEITDGNLSVHARKLEDAGYVVCHKSFEKRLPRSEYRLTPPGKEAFERYLAHMEAIVDAMKTSLRK